MLVSNYFLTLQTAAEAYFYLGYAVIPLLGDLNPSRPKVPALPWSRFQQYRASLDEQHQWFSEAKFAGLGILTGRISKLVVLDFDSEGIFNTFKTQYPDLLETHTVRSANRQLPHLYFELPNHLHIESWKGQGIDLLSDGRYVVAPPTVIAGQAYKIIRGGMPKTLTERDIRRIQAFLNSHKNTSTLLPPKTQAQVISKSADKALIQYKPTEHDLSALYRHLAASGGRNEALFRASLYARNTGWAVEAAQNCLVTLHSEQKGSNSHKRETPAQRQCEALETINSAFSRPPRPIKSQPSPQQGHISNSVREALMQQGMTYVIRTYEGLLNAGLRPGQVFTAKEAVERLKGLVGRDSVLNALKAGQGDVHFFSPPVSPPNTANAVANDNPMKQTKKCFLLESKNQEKLQGGRPKNTYRIPSNKQMCQILGVKATGSDALEHTDLETAPKTRMALHRELIKRRAGSYSKRWMATRLGVSRRTIYTYNQLISIHSRAMFLETAIRWKTIGRLPLDEPLQGAYLQTLRGKKYPALRQIASHLLAKGEILCLRQQTANFYWYGDIEPSPLVWASASKEQVHKQEMRETFLSLQSIKAPMIHQPIIADRPRLGVPVRSRKKQFLSSNDYKKPLRNSANETLARHLYVTLNKIAGIEFQKLSQATARQLVTTYDEALLLNTLDTLKKRSTTEQIRNPAGFFITLVRSTNRASKASQA